MKITYRSLSFTKIPRIFSFRWFGSANKRFLAFMWYCLETSRLTKEILGGFPKEHPRIAPVLMMLPALPCACWLSEKPIFDLIGIAVVIPAMVMSAILTYVITFAVLLTFLFLVIGLAWLASLPLRNEDVYG